MLLRVIFVRPEQDARRQYIVNFYDAPFPPRPSCHFMLDTEMKSRSAARLQEPPKSKYESAEANRRAERFQSRAPPESAAARLCACAVLCVCVDRLCV